MKKPVTLNLGGYPLGANGVSSISICRGTNLVGVPLVDGKLERVSDLLTTEGSTGNVTSIAVWDNGEFKIVSRVGDDGDIPIKAGQSFVLFAGEEGNIPLIGEGWNNDSTKNAPTNDPG